MGGEERGRKRDMGWWKEVNGGGKGVKVVGDGGLCGWGLDYRMC